VQRLRQSKSRLSSTQGAQPRWRWAPGVFALALVLGLAQLGQLDTFERWLYQQTLNNFAPDVKSGQVVVLTLSPSDDSLELLSGALSPLSRARSIGVMLPLQEGEHARALQLVQQRVVQQEEKNAKPGSEPLATLKVLAGELDSAGRLEAALAKSRQVILGVASRTMANHPFQALANELGVAAAADRPWYELLPSVISPLLPTVAEWQQSSPRFASSAKGVGLITADGMAFPALLNGAHGSEPSLLLQMLRLDYGVFDKGKLDFSPSHGIVLGKAQLATDRGYRLYPFTRFPPGLDGLTHYPLSGVAAGEYSRSQFRGKSVFIGNEDDPQLVMQARAMAALLQQKLVRVPGWALWGQYGALVTVTLLLMLLLPRMGYTAAAVTTVLMTLLLLNGEFLLLLLGKQWLPLALPLLVLWLGYPLITFRHYLAMRHERLAEELSSANRQLGRLLQSQGELEQAMEKYRRSRVDEALLEQLYHLGLDFERKRQFSKAVSVFQYLDSLSRGFRDVDERIKRNQSMEQRIVLAKGGGGSADATVIMSSEGLQNPTLGHYQIEREIGRGAMGMVYLGKDPRIGRAVAIKTMALSSEFEATQLEEVKARFYREAETAGRLNHPNIVHVYDIGEEQELAYIAMDYLKGQNLGHFTKRAALLPISEVLGIATQVAEALDYAHKQNVVHRDIKPANIIYDSKEGSVKVTDFGVACLTDSSKTKTGTVLGSPSYMSPEQVAGKRVDGRADIFSLGVTLYQLVTGHLPFEADSLGSLMYKIANEAHPKPSKYRKGIPICVSRIINKCMQKEPQKRYQSGEELAAALKRCRGK